MITTTSNLKPAKGATVWGTTALPDFTPSFGSVIVVLPGANHDLESPRTVKEGEAEASAKYATELANFLYANMGGADFDNLRRALNAKPACR